MQVSTWILRDGVGPATRVFTLVFFMEVYGLFCNDFIKSLYM